MTTTLSGRLKLYDAEHDQELFVTIALVRDADGTGLVVRPDDARDLEATRLGDGTTVPLPPGVMVAIVTAIRITGDPT